MATQVAVNNQEDAVAGLAQRLEKLPMQQDVWKSAYTVTSHDVRSKTFAQAQEAFTGKGELNQQFISFETGSGTFRSGNYLVVCRGSDLGDDSVGGIITLLHGEDYTAEITFYDWTKGQKSFQLTAKPRGSKFKMIIMCLIDPFNPLMPKDPATLGKYCNSLTSKVKFQLSHFNKAYESGVPLAGLAPTNDVAWDWSNETMEYVESLFMFMGKKVKSLKRDSQAMTAATRSYSGKGTFNASFCMFPDGEKWNSGVYTVLYRTKGTTQRPQPALFAVRNDEEYFGEITFAKMEDNEISLVFQPQGIAFELVKLELVRPIIPQLSNFPKKLAQMITQDLAGLKASHNTAKSLIMHRDFKQWDSRFGDYKQIQKIAKMSPSQLTEEQREFINSA